MWTSNLFMSYSYPEKRTTIARLWMHFHSTATISPSSWTGSTLSLTGALVSWPTTWNSPRRRARETRRRSRRQPWTWLPCLIIPLGIFNLILCSVVVVVVVVVAVRVAFPSCDTSWVPIFLNICICICMGLPNVTLMIALTVDTVQHMHSPFLFPRTFN